MTEPRVELAGLRIADPPARWRALGFAADGERMQLGGIDVEFGDGGEGIVSWTLRHGPSGGDIDGLVTAVADGEAVAATAEHPNGAVGIDHVVVTTPDFDRTAAKLSEARMALRRIRDAGSFRQGFRRLGPAILELVEVPQAPPGPARFWGLVVIVADLRVLSQRLGPLLGEVRAAVQPGRHIATVAHSVRLGPKVAFMDPEVR